MSIVLTLVSMAALITVTTAETISTLLDKCEQGRLSEPIPTRFNNKDLLMKTVLEHGIEASCSDEGVIIANCIQGKLVYAPDGVDGAYTVRVEETSAIDQLAFELNAIDFEYDANVQSYTYDHIMENLPPNMSVEAEHVLEDNSILITLAVD